MKKLLSIILSAAMLATSTAFAAPVAVAPENAEEQVAYEAPAMEIEQEAQVEADLAAEVAANVRALEFGVTDFYDTMQSASINNSSNGTVEKDSTAGTVTFTSTNGGGYPAFLSWVSRTLYSGREYTYYVDFSDDTTITKFWPRIQDNQLAAHAGASMGNFAAIGNDTDITKNTFSEGVPYKKFKLAEGKTEFSFSCYGIMTASTNVSATLYGVAMYSKPTATETAPTPVYSGNTAAVKYENGLHDEVKAALQVAGAISGVTDVAIDGNTVTYTIEKGKDIVIPALVNGTNDAVYPEQTLRIEIPDVHSVWFGEKVFLEDFESGKTFTASDNAVTAAVQSRTEDNGNAIKITTTGHTTYPGIVFKNTTTTYDFTNKNYSLFVEIVESSEEALRTRFGGAGWWYTTAGGTKYFNVDDGDYIKTYNGGKYHVEQLTQTSDITENAFSNKSGNITNSFGVLLNPNSLAENLGRYIILDNFGIYSKPKSAVTSAASITATDKTNNTVSVTFPEGVLPATAAALVEYPTAISGVTAVSQSGNTFTFTIERNKDVTIPALVNAAGTATYSEVTLRIDDPDVHSVWFGKKIFFENFEKNTSFASTQSLVSATVVDRTDIDGKALKISTNGGFSDFTSTITLGSETVTPDLTNCEYSFFVEVVGFNEITETNTSIIRARYGNQGALYFNKKISNSPDNLYLDDSFETLGGKTYNVQSTETNIVLNTGVTSVAPKIMLNPYSTAGEERWMTIDNYGIYYKPKAEATATELVYSCETNQFSITYPNGIYSATLDALLDNPTLIDGVTAISKTENTGDSITLTYTYADGLGEIKLPSFINRAENATYAANAVEIIVVPKNVEKGIRTDVKNYGMGLRSVAKVNQEVRLAETEGTYSYVEYGTLVTLDTILVAASKEANDLTFETKASGVNIIDKASYDSTTGATNKLTDDNGYDTYAAVFVNIPVTVEAYTTDLVFRHYVKYTVNDNTYTAYGNPITASPYSVATEIYEAAVDKEEPIAKYCKQIIDACDGVEGAVLPDAVPAA